MSVYSPTTPSSINIGNMPIPTQTATTIHPATSDDSGDMSSDDSEDEGDQPVYRFRVANPDMPSESTHKDNTPSTSENRTSPILKTPIPAESIQTAQQSTDTQAPTLPNHETKALPNIPSTLAPLQRRQSKTLGSEETSISDIVEYHSRASILEPLTVQQDDPSLDRPKLIIPPAPSHPPPPPRPPTKEKARSSIMTIPPSNDSQDERQPEQQHKRSSIRTIPPSTDSEDERQPEQQHKHSSIRTIPPSNDSGDKRQPEQQHKRTSSNGTNQQTTPKPTSAPTTNKKPGHHVSKYHHASYSLTNNPDAIKIYREMAEKTQDDMTQLTYAKYLLEVAELYQPAMMVKPDGEEDTKKQLETEMRKKKALEQEGIRWIRRLSKKGVGEAAFLEATWMETEQYGYKTRHASRIERLYQVAIQAGVPEASYRLALRKESANTQPYYDIYRLYQRAADLHCVAAIYKMAKIYLHGQLDQQQDFKKGMTYLLSAVRHASMACNEPPYALALILSNKYTKVSIPSELIQSYGGVTKVREYMETSAKLGNIGAKNRLGHLCEHGSYGPMDMALAFMYYDEAAKQGHLQSMLGLSRLYNSGCHGPNDHDEHYRFTNDTSGWLASHPRDEDQSFYWCQRAAKGGLPDALYLLGWYYEIGFGTPRNDHLSVEYYQQASRKGQLDAKDRLAARH